MAFGNLPVMDGSQEGDHLHLLEAGDQPVNLNMTVTDGRLEGLVGINLRSGCQVGYDVVAVKRK